MRSALARLTLILAIVLFSPHVKAEEETPQHLASQAQIAAAAGESSLAVKMATLALEKDHRLASMHYLRGREYFRLGKIAESAADFDQYVQLRPQAKPRLWERGITLYYAGRYRDGADQFALYQTYLSNDFENAAWRFLCMAKQAGVDEAKAELLPIADDGRIPMMTLYRFYQGKATQRQVLDAVAAGEIGESERAGRRFYAALYLGLYYEATGEPDKAAAHLAEAADPNLQKQAKDAINAYMADVARVHWARKKAAKKKLSP